MLISDPFDLEIAGRKAVLHVVRNDGFCWGRVMTPDGERDVDPPAGIDPYDWSDEDAATVLITQAQAGQLQPIAGSPIWHPTKDASDHAKD